MTADGTCRLHPVPPQSSARCDELDEIFFTQRAVPSLWCLRWVCRENNVPIMQGKTPLFRWLKSALVESMPESMGRREWMRGMAVSALAGSGVSCLSGRRPDAGPVAIVGAGTAGLTAAYRLMKAGQTVHLYEASDRVGGRMFTQPGFNEDGMFVERGGELVDTNHRAFFQLAGELGLKMQNLLKGEEGHDFFWFDQRLRSEHDVVTGFRPLGAIIAADAEGLYDEQGEFTEKARLLDQQSLGVYLDDRCATVEPWVKSLIVAAYEPEFGVDVSRQSCLNLIDFIEPDVSGGFEVFGESDEGWRVEGGNAGLPNALLARIQEGVDLRKGHPLKKMGEEGEQVALTFDGEGKGRREVYSKVVLALPFSVLRRVEGWQDLPMSAEKKRCINELGYGSNVKVFRSFKERVWRQPRPGVDGIGNGSIFAEQSTFQNVWETSRGQEGKRGILINLLGGRRGLAYRDSGMGRYLDELDEVVPGLKQAFDGKAGSMNWPKMPWALGSYSCPLVGQYTWVYQAAAAPEWGGCLVFAGEHTSLESPGYMNGAVDSGNRAAREILGAVD